MGLQRKKITVRSKKGKTYQRSVMVKAGQPTKAAPRRKAMRNEEKQVHGVNRFYHFGMANAGLGVGSNLGRLSGMKKDPHFQSGHAAGHQLTGSVGGAVAGYGIGRATSKHLSNRSKLVLGAMGHAAGLFGTMYNHEKNMAAIDAEYARRRRGR